ncbi:hypothetical protein EDB83DRAFT_2338552 [Lactarius deliciosus]|nr:hypothetical protein EDB83DRAFT_2338552 [Lactarius deliciosus]
MTYLLLSSPSTYLLAVPEPVTAFLPRYNPPILSNTPWHCCCAISPTHLFRPGRDPFEPSSQDFFQSVLALPSSCFCLVHPLLLAPTLLVLGSNASHQTPFRDCCLSNFYRSSFSLSHCFLPLIWARLQNLLYLSTHTHPP